MSGHVHLLGSEDVSRAGHNMQQAADTISRAANTIDSANERLGRNLEQHSYQIGALAEALAGTPSLRHYFMAHAPAEPQHWFDPVMPPCPADAFKPEDLTLEEQMEINGHRNETLDLEDMKEPRAIAYIKGSSEAYDAQQVWKRERDKQRWVQWPAAWADEQMKARQV